jgi:ACS family probable galactarate transporter
MFFMRFMLGFSKRRLSRQTPVLWRPGSRPKSAVPHPIFNSAQYFSLALFSPLLGWLTFAWGWEHVFTVMGVIGFVLTGLWVKLFITQPIIRVCRRKS